MNELTAQVPLSIFIYKRRTFSPKLYIKRECSYVEKNPVMKAVLTSAGAAGAAFMFVAVMAFLQ